MKIVLEYADKILIETHSIKQIRSFFGENTYIDLKWGDINLNDMQLKFTIIPRKPEVTCDELRDLNNQLNSFFGESIKSPVNSAYRKDGAVRFNIEFKRNIEIMVKFLNTLNIS